ncbi:MAG: hypothetical protein HY812_12280 [Planctomycetes bacterium]|nr:hypothetical protein [Planctomycetota bacterium]
MPMLRRTAVPLFLFAAGLATWLVAAARQEEPAEAPAAVPALERIALIGASVTDGFLLPAEVDAMVTLADVVRAACVPEVEAPFRKSTMLFFRNPVDYGTRYARAARAQDPTLLIAIDFLFWFGYGFIVEEEDRLQQLEEGLALLGEFSCPVLVGDFPDMMPAAREGVGIHGAPMISEWQVPQKETLARLNARLQEWADARKNVHVVKLSRFYERLRAGEGVEVRGCSWPEGCMKSLMDKDLLHPTFEGAIAMTLLALDVLVQADPAVPESAFRWDKEMIRARVLEARKAERAQRQAGAARGQR